MPSRFRVSVHYCTLVSAVRQALIGPLIDVGPRATGLHSLPNWVNLVSYTFTCRMLVRKFGPLLGRPQFVLRKRVANSLDPHAIFEFQED